MNKSFICEQAATLMLGWLVIGTMISALTQSII